MNTVINFRVSKKADFLRKFYLNTTLWHSNTSLNFDEITFPGKKLRSSVIGTGSSNVHSGFQKCLESFVVLGRDSKRCVLYAQRSYFA